MSSKPTLDSSLAGAISLVTWGAADAEKKRGMQGWGKNPTDYVIRSRRKSGTIRRHPTYGFRGYNEPRTKLELRDRNELVYNTYFIFAEVRRR